MAEYKSETKEKADGTPSIRYRLGSAYVAAAEVPEDVKSSLLDLPEGTVVDETGLVVEKEEAPVEPTTAPEVPAIDTADDIDDESGVDEEIQPAPAPVDEEGMGFKRVKGKTVDVFDGKTPHTQVRYVAGIMVPLSEESFKTRTDAEIMDKLRKLGKVA